MRGVGSGPSRGVERFLGKIAANPMHFRSSRSSADAHLGAMVVEKKVSFSWVFGEKDSSFVGVG